MKYICLFFLQLCFYGSIKAQEFIPYNFEELSFAVGDDFTTKKWAFKDSVGHTIAIGAFNNGAKDGKWIYYGEYNTPQILTRYSNDKLDGRYIQYYPNSSSYHVITQLSEGVVSGNYVQFDKDGKQKFRGTYKNNKREGNWFEFVNNQVASLTPYSHGVIEGKMKIFYTFNGMIAETFEYKAGVKEGVYQLFDEFGKLLVKGLYSNNRKSGTWGSYYKNRKIQSKFSYNTEGKLQGDSLAYFPNGSLKSKKTFLNGDPIGEWFDKHTENKYALNATYNQLSQLHGEYREKHKNGLTKFEGTFSEGEKVGVWKTYNQSGSLSSMGSYKNNSQHGNWKTFHETGTLESEGSYTFGIPTGQWFFYHDNGKLMSVGSFDKFGDRIGIWGNFYATGKLMQENQWKNGLLVSIGSYLAPDRDEMLDKGSFKNGQGCVFIYNENGLLLREENYINGKLNGDWIEYFPHKKKKKMKAIKGKMLDGMKFGFWQYFFKNGQVESEGSYKYNQAIGKWKFYSRYGELVNETIES